jgi:hypothetical protein
MDGNTTGADNVGVGAYALAGNTTASNNTAIGKSALYANTTASNNTAVGTSALTATTTGANNVVVGASAMTVSTTGGNSVAIGVSALGGLTDATACTAVGWQAGLGNTTGDYNTYLGQGAGGNVTTGTVGLYLGYAAQAAAVTDSECIVIVADGSGAGRVGKGSNTGFINANLGSIYQGNNSASWATTSDERIKKNITDNTVGLDALNQIRVRNFEYRTETEITDFENPQSAVVEKTGIQLGVIAQEIEKILPDMVTEETTGVKSVNPDNLTWYLVNSIQQLSAQVDALTARITTLEG